MLESMQAGLAGLLQPTVLIAVIFGAMIGLLIGTVPGINNITVVAMLLPLIWGVPPQVGLGYLIGQTATVGLSDCILSILIAVPGEGPSIASIPDGYALNRKGYGARTIGSGIFASVSGGIVSMFLGIFAVWGIKPIVMAFGAAELLLMIVLGLSFLVVLSGDSPIKGLISGGIGLLLSLVGFAARSGISRFTFGSNFFYDGISLAVLGPALFGISAMAELFLGGEATISLGSKLPRFRDVIQGARDVFRHWRIFWMAAPLATIIGIIPGLGRSAAAWMSLGLAKQISKNPEEFGTGRIEGVIAPETANNSTSAGALITTLSFGVPGSAVMAFFAGALIMVGITPGPQLLREHMDLVYLLLFGIGLANIVGGTVCLLGVSWLARLAYVPLDYLFPGLIAIIFVATYTVQGSIMTLIPLLFGAILGVAMKKFRYPMAPLILAFVMGKIFEYYIWNAIDFRGPLFFLRPIPLIIIGIIIVLYGFAPVKRLLHKAEGGG